MSSKKTTTKKVDKQAPADATPADDAAPPVEIDGHELHEYCAMYPDMNADEFRDLLDSVRQHGPMSNKPVVMLDGKILDGRNRYKAYLAAGVNPIPTVEYADICGGFDGTALDWVIAENEMRRHLDATARGLIGNKLLKIRAAENGGARRKRGSASVDGKKPTLRAEVAAEMNVSEGYLNTIGQIEETAPEVYKEMERGEIKVPEAKRKAGVGSKQKPHSLTLVNGDEGSDAAVEKARRGGKIPTDAQVSVTDHGDEETRLEDVAHDVGERLAKADEVPDEEWVETLPLAHTLTGLSLKIFKADAIAWRGMKAALRSYRKTADAVFKAARKGTSKDGEYMSNLSRHLKFKDPERWKICAAPAVDGTKGGGCGGVGSLPMTGECKKCYGRGYTV